MLFSACDHKDIPVVKLGHAPHDHHASLYIAADKQDYFKDHGGIYLKEVEFKKKYQLIKNDKHIADIVIDSSTGGINLIRKLDENLLDMSFGGVPAMIDMIDKGSHIKIIAPVMTEGAALVVDRSMPVSNWAEFVGYVKKSERPIKIGYKVAVSVQNLIFESALKEEKLSFSRDLSSEDVDIIVVNLHGPNNLSPSLEAQIIDGFVVMQPYPALAEYEKKGKIIAHLKSLPPVGKWENHPCCALAVNTDFIKSHREVIEALVELFQNAGDYISENHPDSAGIVAKWLGTPEEVEKLSLPTIKFVNEYDKLWDSGIQVWLTSLIDRGDLSGVVKTAYERADVNTVLYDNSFYDNIRKRTKKNVNK